MKKKVLVISSILLTVLLILFLYNKIVKDSYQTESFYETSKELYSSIKKKIEEKKIEDLSGINANNIEEILGIKIENKNIKQITLTYDDNKKLIVSIQGTENINNEVIQVKEEEVKKIDKEDIIAPLITLKGEKVIHINLKDEYEEPGITVVDDTDKDLSSKVITTNNIDTSKIGVYTVTYIVTDTAGNKATITREVRVVDNIIPIINLIGNSEITIEKGKIYQDLGATAQDNYDSDITNNIVVTINVNTNTVRTYYVKYNVSDSSGNSAVEQVRTVKVIEKKESTPIINLIGEKSITLKVGTTFNEPGVKATDSIDGDITKKIVITNNINKDKIGTYSIKYNVTNSLGTKAIEVVRTVTVVDTVIPTITLNGNKTMSIEVGSTYTDLGATAIDNYDGNITTSIITTNSVNTNKLGTYTIKYNVKDTSNNSAIEVIRTVNVIDTTKPIITLTGNNTVNIEVGNTYTDLGAKATDNYDGDITESIVVTNNVNTDVVGTYIVTYNVKDSSGNESVEVIRTVNVMPIPLTAESCFNFNSTTKSITSYYNYESNNSSNPACPKKVNIPATIGGVNVISIANNAFLSKQLTSVIIPNSITSIGSYAFSDNQITSVTLNNGIETIGSNAFLNNRLTNITIPYSVYSIQSNAFIQTAAYPWNIVTINYNDAAPQHRLNNIISSIGFGSATINYEYEEAVNTSESCFAFDTITGTITNYYNYENNNNSNRSCPREVVIPNSISGISVIKIGDSAFSSKSIKGVIIPNSITNIGSSAFSSNQLTSITIPNNVTIINDFTFSYNQIKSVIIPNSVISIGRYAFRENQLTSITLNNGLETIGMDAFINNRLTTITVPYTVYEIQSNAFSQNTSYPWNIVTIKYNEAAPQNRLSTSASSIGFGSASINYEYEEPVNTSESCFAFDTSTGTITGYYSNENNDSSNKGCPKQVVIPVRINGILINKIGNGAFKSKGIKGVRIPTNITSIGSYAFQSNQLKNVIIPNSVTSIDSYAFSSNQLKNVIIPNSVTSIGSYAFSSNQLTSLTIPDNVTSIGSYAFSSNQLTSLTIPSSVISIGSYAFSSNQLTSLTIPNSVTSIGESAFSSNQLTSVTISNNVTIINDFTFSYNKITSLTIPSSVISIGRYAFRENQLTSVTLNNGLETIGMNAFIDNRLTTITIPYTVYEIQSNAFSQNTSYPWNIVTIKHNEAAPQNRLNNFSSIGFGSASINYEYEEAVNTAESCFEFDTITGTITGYYSNENNDSSNKECSRYVIIPSSINGISVIKIGDNAFKSKSIKGVIMPNEVTAIGIYAFQSNRLKGVTIPNNVTSIGTYAFSSNQLKGVTIPNNVTSIGTYAFSSNQLTNVTIPNRLTTIDSYVFSNNQLTILTIPDNVTSIGNSAFRDNQLTNVTIPNSVTRIDDYAFRDNQLTNVTIPSSVTNIGSCAFYYNKLTSVTISNGVKSIENSAFAYNQLKSLIIPSSVISISNYAFRENQLTSVTLNNGIETIGNNAFLNNRLTNITIPYTVYEIQFDAFTQTPTYPWETVTIIGNSTNLNTRFDSSLSSIGWGRATVTINRINE